MAPYLYDNGCLSNLQLSPVYRVIVFKNLFRYQPGISHRITIHQHPELPITSKPDTTVGKSNRNGNIIYSKLLFQYLPELPECLSAKLFIIFMSHTVAGGFLVKIALKRLVEIHAGLIGQAQ